MTVVLTRMEILNPRNSFIALCNKTNGNPIRGVEVGVYEGVNAVAMLVKNENLRLDLVDSYNNLVIYTGGPLAEESFRDAIKNIARENLSYFKDRVRLIYKSSEQAYSDYKDGELDYVYLDGDHEYEATLRDLRLWYPKVKEGGILGGHDASMKEVHTALCEFITENELKKEKVFVDAPSPYKSDFWIYK